VNADTFNPVTVGAATVNTAAGLVTVPIAAVIFVVPCAAEVANPLPLIVAVAGVPDTHVAVLLTSSACVAPAMSLYVPVATNCCVVPSGIDGAAGVTAMD
jgi:hypothetical protein